MYDRVPVKNLLHKHEEYLALQDAWEQLNDFDRGAPYVNARREFYLPKKIGETDEEYQNRLKKFAYTPHLSNAIRETTAKLAAAPLYVDGADDTYWSYVRKHLDGKQLTENKLIKNIFSSLCYYGRAYAIVERPPLSQIPMSKAEQEALLSQGKAYPTVQVINPLAVTDWSLEDDWFVITTVKERYAPLATPVTVATWKLYTPLETWVYEAKVQLTGGRITSVWLDRDDGTGGSWRSVNDPDALLTGTVTQHGLGVNPVAYAVLKEELWIGGMTYSEQVQHIRVKSQLAEAGYIAGTVVRVFTPSPPVEKSPKALMSGGTPPPKADHSHTLIGANYAFVESTGSAIDNLLKVLNDSELYIQSVVSLDYKARQTQQLQSADSKQIDTSLVEDVMRLFGNECLTLYQSVLNLFCAYDGKPPVTAQGLNNYGNDTLDQMLAQSQSIEVLCTVNRIPRTALMQWYARLANLLAGDIFGAQEAEMGKELEELFSEEAMAAQSSQSTDVAQGGQDG